MVNRLQRLGLFALVVVLIASGIATSPLGEVRGQDGSPVAADLDADGVPDAVDTCVEIANPDRLDADGDGLGDACDSTPNGDSDGDGVDEWSDLCPGFDDAADANGNGVPDGCDAPSTEIPLPASETTVATATDVPAPTTAPAEPVSAAADGSDENTPAGEWVWVDLGGGFKVLFEYVLQAGLTTASDLTMKDLPELPDGHVQGPGAVISIASTASWSGQAYVCGPFDEAYVGWVSYTSIFQLVEGSWVVVGTGLDENLGSVCGVTYALGVFTVGGIPKDEPTSEGNTWAGMNVDPYLDHAFRVRFDMVTASGQTTAASLDPARLPPLPVEFAPTSIQAAEIGTTATWEGRAYVCGPYEDEPKGDLSYSSIFQLQGGVWVEIGNGLDKDYSAICGYIDSLGIFATARIHVAEETPALTMAPANMATSTATQSATASASATGSATALPMQLLLDGMPESRIVAANETVRISVSSAPNQLFTAFKYVGEHCEGLSVDTVTSVWFEQRLVNPENVTSSFSHSYRLRDPGTHEPAGECLFIRWVALTPTATRTPLPSATPTQTPIVSPTPTGTVQHLLLDGHPDSVIVPADVSVRLSASGGSGPFFSYARFAGELCTGIPEHYPRVIWTDQGLVNPESVLGQFSLSYRLRDDATGELIGDCLFIRWIALTPTPSSTALASATGTATSTATETATGTSTPTATETATATPSATETHTATSTASSTETAQPSDTATSTASAAASRTPTPPPVFFSIGTRLTTTQEVRLRFEPRNSSDSTRRLSAGTIVTVTGTPIFEGAIVWYPVSAGNEGGWIDGRFLQAAPTPTPTVTASATSRSPYNYPAGTILIASQNTTLATSPGAGMSKTPDVPMGTEVTVTGAPVAMNGRTWLPVLVSFGSGSGWVDAAHVQPGPLPTVTGTPPTVTRTPTRAPGQYLTVGDRVLITTAVNLRDTPSPTGLIVMIAPNGTTGFVTGLPVRVGTDFFYPVVLDGLPGGYLPQSALLRIAANTTITPTRTPTITQTPAHTQTPTRTPTRHPGNVFSPGNAVVVSARTPTNLRSAPSSSAPVIGVVVVGQVGVVMGHVVRDGNVYYYPVQFDGYPLGYLPSSALGRADGNAGWQLTQTPIRSATATSTPVAKQWIVAAVHLRNGPSTSFSILLVLAGGSEVTVTGERVVDGTVVWFRVRTSGGTIGWVPGTYLTAASP